MRSVIRISLTYAVLAGLWVVFSDDFLLLMFRDPTRLIQYEKAKGLVFIVLSAALIYALASRHVRQIERGQALQSAKDREFRYLFLNNPLPMWVFDRETLRFLEVNEAALRKYGYTREEFLSMRISDIRPPEDLPRLYQQLGSVGVAVTESKNWRHRLKDGRLIDVDVASHALSFLGREAWLVVVYDVTERKRLEDELRRQQLLYRALARNLPKGSVFLYDHELRFMVAEGQGLAEAGLTPEQIEGKTLYEAGSPGTAAFLEPMYRAALRGDTQSAQRVYAGRHYQLYCLPVHDARGEVWAGLAVGYDVTDLETAYDATIEALASAIDLRDHETQGHSRRVAELSVQLGKAMGMPEQELAAMLRGALLHDVGKLGVPDTILLKPGKLSEEEWAVMKQHPVLAQEWLSRIPFLRSALEIPYAHHERWDGSGYPRGLKGEEIPLLARVFAVADVYDALTSDRPYRPALGHREALDYIAAQAGQQFDPQVVEKFLPLMQSRPPEKQD